MAEVRVTPQMVRSLRQRTGAGINDCKQALIEAGGDEDKAVEIIQKKGLAKAAKKASAVATEGMVHAYVHPGDRLGSLVEVNCQTDFAARNEEFRRFVHEVAMQVVALSPRWVRREDVPEDVLAKQKEIYLAQITEEERRTGKSKPEQAKQRFVEDRLNKWLREVCLMEQPYLADEKITVAEAAAQLSAKLGEKVEVRRFVRFELGEGLQAQSKDFAKEVAKAVQEADGS